MDVDFSIRGPDLEALNRYSEAMREAAIKIPGLVDVDTTLRMNKPEIQVEIDRDRAVAGVAVAASCFAGCENRGGAGRGYRNSPSFTVTATISRPTEPSWRPVSFSSTTMACGPSCTSPE